MNHTTQMTYERIAHHDTHRIANLEPADYSLDDVIDTDIPQYQGIGQSMEEYEYAVRAHRAYMASITQMIAPYSLYNCTHCGAHIRYAAILTHIPTGEKIVVGSTCIDTRFSFASRADMLFDKTRRAAAAHAASAKVNAAAMKFIDTNTDLWNTLLAVQHDNDFMHAMVQSVLQYGNLTERQMDATVKAVARYTGWMVTGAACTVDFSNAITEQLAEGRYEITGEVVSIKFSEDFGYGPTKKMLVRLPSGHKVFGSVPSSIASVQKGDTVTFTAKVERKESDFGFFSRPSKATADFATCTEHGYRDCPHHGGDA